MAMVMPVSLCLGVLLVAAGLGTTAAVKGGANSFLFGEELASVRVQSTAPVSTIDEHSPWVEQVGKHPKVYLIHGFLTDEERRHILTLAAPEMKRSTVSGAGGRGVVDNIRTSYGMFIRRMADPIIERVERRISLFTQIPISHQSSYTAKLPGLKKE